MSGLPASRLLLFAVTCGFFVASAVGRAAPYWTQPVRMTPATDDPGSSSPAIAMNAAGDSAMLWNTSVGGTLEMLRSVFRNAAAAGWSAPRDVAPVSGIESAAASVDDAGRMTAVFSDGWVRAAAGERGVWDSFVTLSSQPFKLATYEDLAVNGNGVAVAVWSGFFDDVVQAGVRPGATTRWQPPKELFRASGGSGIPLSAPAVAVDRAGNALCVWTWWGDASQQETQQVVASFRLAGTGAWEPAVVLAGPAQSYRAGVDFGIAVVFDHAGNATAVWGAAAGQLTASWRPFGGGWSPPTTLHAQGRFEDLRLGVDADGATLAVWHTRSGVNSSVFRPSAGRWEQITAVTGARPIWDLDLAVDQRGNAVAVWSEGEWTKGATLWAALRPAASRRWMAPTLVRGGSKNEYAWRPDVAIDAAGNATAVWELFDGNFGIETADLRPSGPMLERLVIPRRAKARSPISFSVRPVSWAAAVTGKPKWRFGDGHSGSGARVRHVYRRAGLYEVSVTTHDTTGAASNATAGITVSRH